MNWIRIVAWSALILAVANAIAFCSGLTMGHWEIYGPTIDDAVANNRLVRRLLIGCAVALLYWRFAAGIAARRFLHVLAVFLSIQVMDIVSTAVLFGTAIQELFDPWALARGLSAALIGYGLSRLSSHHSFKPDPLREPA